MHPSPALLLDSFVRRGRWRLGEHRIRRRRRHHHNHYHYSYQVQKEEEEEEDMTTKAGCGSSSSSRRRARMKKNEDKDTRGTTSSSCCNVPASPSSPSPSSWISRPRPAPTGLHGNLSRPASSFPSFPTSSSHVSSPSALPSSSFACRQKQLHQQRPLLLVLGSLVVASVVRVCDAQDNPTERTEDGKERGPNSQLAKEVESYLPALIGGLVALVVILFCCSRVRERLRENEQEEAEAEAAKQEASAAAMAWGVDLESAMSDNLGLKPLRSSAASSNGVERISRTGTTRRPWDKKTPSALSTESNSSRDEAFSTRSGGESEVRDGPEAASESPREGRRALVNPLPPSSLPRY